MELKPWNPWQELERLQAEMDQDFRSFLDKLRPTVPGMPIGFVPPIDVVEADEEYRFYLSVPGMVEEDLDIALQGRLLIIRGEREPPYELKSVRVLQAQSKYGFFERRIELPSEVFAESVQASYEAGILTIHVPKPQTESEPEKAEGGQT